MSQPSKKLSQINDRERKGTEVPHVPEAVLPPPQDITDELIESRCTTLRDAVRLCRECSPLSDDEMLWAIEQHSGRKLQRSHFSEALSRHGDRNFPVELVTVLEDICGNIIPTRFMALNRNCELRRRRESWEIENLRLKAELQESRKEKDTITRFLREIGARI